MTDRTVYEMTSPDTLVSLYVYSFKEQGYILND